MNNWITFLWQSNLCLLIFFLGYTLWLSKEQCFNYRRIYLIGGGVISLVLPLLQFSAISQWFSNRSLQLPISLTLPDLIIGSAFESGLDPATALIGIYLFICLIFCGILLFRIWKTIALINRCKDNLSTYRGHNLYLTLGRFPSSSYFNFLLWDNTIDVDKLHKNLILDHEIIHIHQGHSYDVLFLELLKIVFWFNPVVWYLLKELRNVHEYIADYQVVDSSNRKQYTKFLAQQTLVLSNIPWVHHFNKNFTLKRINMIDSTQNPTRFWKYGILAGIYILLQVFVSCTEGQLSSEGVIDEVYTLVDEHPRPFNGMNALYEEIGSKLKYPEQARRMGIEGKVYVEFVVQKSGKVTDIKVLKGIGAGCDEAAKMVMSGIEDWNPGKMNGHPVAVIMQMPIIFKLNQNN